MSKHNKLRNKVPSSVISELFSIQTDLIEKQEAKLQSSIYDLCADITEAFIDAGLDPDQEPVDTDIKEVNKNLERLKEARESFVKIIKAFYP